MHGEPQQKKILREKNVPFYAQKNRQDSTIFVQILQDKKGHLQSADLSINK